jgi:hypothetical protein
MDKVKNIFKLKTVSVVSLVAIALLVTIIVIQLAAVIYVSVGVGPSLKYSINKKKGLYPTERELGSSVWISESPKIKLTIYNDIILGEISTNEKTYFLQGYFFFGTLGFTKTEIDLASKSYIDVTILEADYEYRNGKIEVSNIRNFTKYITIDQDFVLEKEKKLDKNLVQTYQCEEVNIFLKIPEETDIYARGKHHELNDLKIDLVKRSSEHYFLELSIDNHQYIIVGTLKKENDIIVFDIMFIKNIITDKDIYEGPLSVYFPRDVKSLTFVKCRETESEETGDASKSLKK